MTITAGDIKPTAPYVFIIGIPFSYNSTEGILKVMRKAEAGNGDFILQLLCSLTTPFDCDIIKKEPERNFK
jgi:hypothetical protein